MSKPVLVLGAGGHAAVVVDILRQLKCDIVGLVSKDILASQPIFSELTLFSSDDEILRFENDDILLVNAIGSLPGYSTRFEVHERYKDLGYTFMKVISPLAMVSKYAVLDEGVQIMPGCIVNANVSIGSDTIVNSGAIIEHDCRIGSHNHIAPGAILCGGVVTGDSVHVAVGAKVIQGINIGARTVVGAGATVIKNLDADMKIYGPKSFLKSEVIR